MGQLTLRRDEEQEKKGVKENRDVGYLKGSSRITVPGSFLIHKAEQRGGWRARRDGVAPGVNNLGRKASRQGWCSGQQRREGEEDEKDGKDEKDEEGKRERVWMEKERDDGESGQTLFLENLKFFWQLFFIFLKAWPGYACKVIKLQTRHWRLDALECNGIYLTSAASVHRRVSGTKRVAPDRRARSVPSLLARAWRSRATSPL